MQSPQSPVATWFGFKVVSCFFGTGSGLFSSIPGNGVRHRGSFKIASVSIIFPSEKHLRFSVLGEECLSRIDIFMENGGATGQMRRSFREYRWT